MQSFGHHADMLLFIKHNVIIIEFWYWYWVLVSLEVNIIGHCILGAFLGIVLTIIISKKNDLIV